ncbi:MAG TPA: IclR family transcriptional regulator [Rhodanobacter sp.]|nr:IclR family transcriptional regulator [Rhodanobacter sp.]
MGNPKRGSDAFSKAVDANHPQFVSAVARAFAILRCFEHGEHYLGNQEIARRTGLPKPTVSRLAFTLSSLGYLSYSPGQEKYALGTGVLALGHAFKKGNDVLSIARPLMQELATYTQSAVMLGAADGLRMVVLEVCQGDPTFQMKLESGARVPHGSTALGRADLAARPLEVFEARLAELERDCEPAAWPKIRAGIVGARQEYESYGFCFSVGDWNPDVYAIGVPMISADRTRVLAFNCSGRVSVMTREKLIQDFGPKLMALRNTVYEAVEGRF